MLILMEIGGFFGFADKKFFADFILPRSYGLSNQSELSFLMHNQVIIILFQLFVLALVRKLVRKFRRSIGNLKISKI